MMLPMIDSIDVSRTGSRNVYTMKMDDSLNSLLEDLLTALQEELAAMESPVDLTADLQSCTYVYTVGSDGELESCIWCWACLSRRPKMRRLLPSSRWICRWMSTPPAMMCASLIPASPTLRT